MASVAMIYTYVPSLIKTGSGIQKLIRGIHRHTHREQRNLLSLLYFFKIRKVGYKRKYEKLEHEALNRTRT
jgi:hypothetical protein